MPNIIELRDVSFTYESTDGTPVPPALEHIDLDIGEHKFIAILGHNGSGKSTLAKLCNGLLQPGSGTVTVDGLDTASEDNLYEIRRRVGMVFQNPDNQLVATQVEEDVAFGPENLGVPSGEIQARVAGALETVGMLEYSGHATHMLSGGQKQRIAIAGVLAMRPRCIVLDESTAMLDPAGRAEVIGALGRLRDEAGITVVLITHFMDEAVAADEVVVLSQGRIFMQGRPEEIFTQVDRLHSVSLDVPQVTELFWRLGRGGMYAGALPTDEAAAAELLAGMFAGKTNHNLPRRGRWQSALI